MKLKTKLIPLAGAAAVCATVAPITLTACGSTSVGKTIDLSNGYNPTGVQHKYGNLTVEQALNDYAEAIDDNKDVFAQDFFWSKARYIELLPKAFDTNSVNAPYGTSVTLLSAQCQINSLKVEAPQKLIVTTSSTPTDTNEVETREFSVPTLSFDYEYEFSFEAPYEEGDYQIGSLTTTNKSIYTAKGHVTFKSVPFITRPIHDGAKNIDTLPSILAEAFPTYWCFQPLKEWMLSDLMPIGYVEFDKSPKAWSVSYDYEMDISTKAAIGNIERELVDVFTKQGNFLSSNLSHISRDDLDILSLLISPDGSIMNAKMNEHSSASESEMIGMLGIVGGCAYSWYLQLVGVDPTDSPF